MEAFNIFKAFCCLLKDLSEASEAFDDVFEGLLNACLRPCEGHLQACVGSPKGVQNAFGSSLKAL